MIDRLAIFGATGDLTARYLLPALGALRASGQLGDGFCLTGAGREHWDDDEFRRWGSAQLDRHAGHLPAAARDAVVSAARYRRTDVSDAASVAAVTAGDEPVAAYLALPPTVFPATVSALHEACLPQGSRIALEKSFGEDLASAVELNRLLAEVLPEQALFRVDHFLAMTTVQNLLGSRLANRVLEPIWNSAHIAEVAPRPSPRSSSSWTTGAGRGPRSGCAPARRWPPTAKRSRCDSGRCHICRSGSPGRRSRTSCGSDSIQRA